MPETDNPVKQAPADGTVTTKPVELTDDQYHELADVYLEQALAKFEELQDEADELDVEFAVCRVPLLARKHKHKLTSLTVRRYDRPRAE